MLDFSRWAGLSALLVLVATPAAAFEAPDCAALDRWGAGFAGGATTPLNAVEQLPAPFAADATQAVFGQRFLEWTTKDGGLLDRELKACERAAAKAKDVEAAQRFASYRDAAAPALKTLKTVVGARAEMEKALAGLEAGDKPAHMLPELRRLAKASLDEAAKTSTMFRDVGKAARALQALPQAEIGAAQARLAGIADAMSASMNAAAIAAIDAAPATAAGILAVRAAALAAQRDMGEPAAKPIVAWAANKEASIRAALLAGGGASALPPECPPFLDWASRPDFRDTRRARAGSIYVALEAPEVETLFGRAAAQWSAADFELLAALSAHCVDAVEAGTIPGDARALARAARNAGDLARRGPEQAERLRAVAESRDVADNQVAAAAAATDDVPGLDQIAGLLASARSAKLEPEDEARVVEAAEARRQAIVRAALERSEAEIRNAPATLAGLDAARAALGAVMSGPLGRHLTRPEAESFLGDARRRLAAIAVESLPEFKAAVAATSEDQEGLVALKGLEARYVPSDAAGPWAGYRQAVLERRDAIVAAFVEAELPKLATFLDGLPRSPEGLGRALVVKIDAERRAREEAAAYARFAELATARAVALRDALALERCAETTGMSDKEAAQPAFVGGDIAPLGRFVCAIGRGTGGKPSYEGAGLFGSEHRIGYVGAGGHETRLVLKEAEIRPGVKALIGFRMEDPTGGQELDADGWRALSARLAGGDACAPAAARVAADSAHVDPARPLALAACLVEHPMAPI